MQSSINESKTRLDNEVDLPLFGIVLLFMLCTATGITLAPKG